VSSCSILIFILCIFAISSVMCLFRTNSPKFDLPIVETTSQARGKMTLTCHRCNEVGHKAVVCPKASGSTTVSAGDSVNTVTSQHSNRSFYSGFRHDLRPLDQVTCFKVGC